MSDDSKVAMSSHAEAQSITKWDRTDVAALVLFAFTAVVCAGFWWRGVLPFAFLGGDAGLQAIYSAAYWDPEAFAKDPVMYSVENLSFYRIIHLPLILFLRDVFGDFGTGYMAILAPGVFLQMLGFYLLGRSLFEAKVPAFFLALISIGKVDLNVDYWGIIHDFEPRMLYQCLLPFVLLAIVKYGRNPKTWPLLIGLQGLLVWVHPPSAPPMAFATLIGLLCYKPATWSVSRLLTWALISGLTFIVVCSPYVLSFSDARPHGHVANYHELIAIYRGFLGSFYLNPVENIRLYLDNPSFRYFLATWSILGTLAAYASIGADKKRDVAFFVVVLVALILTTFSIGLVDQVYSEATETLPLFYDMIRGFRLVLPIMLILAVWGTYFWFNRYGRKAGIATVSLVSIMWLGINRPGSIPFRETLDCFADARIFCPNDHVKYDFPVLEFLRTEIPRGTLILPIMGDYHDINFTQAIRYYSLKPVTYSYKDGNTILYNNHDLLPAWLASRKAIGEISQEPMGAKKIAKIRELAEKTQSEVVVTDFIVPESLEKIIGKPLGRFEKFSVILVD